MLHSAPPLVHELIDARIHQYGERLAEAEYLIRSLRATARLITALDPNQWIPAIHFAAARFQVPREAITQHIIDSLDKAPDMPHAPETTDAAAHPHVGSKPVGMPASARTAPPRIIGSLPGRTRRSTVRTSPSPGRHGKRPASGLGCAGGLNATGCATTGSSARWRHVARQSAAARDGARAETCHRRHQLG